MRDEFEKAMDKIISKQLRKRRIRLFWFCSIYTAFVAVILWGYLDNEDYWFAGFYTVMLISMILCTGYLYKKLWVK